jgi:crotonobetainyl-CoA:carnitine CoA-transferase CaiB-like acyl-CoA transferase
MDTSHAALHGVRIVECAQDIAGPYAAMLLAEQGADVVKVEPPAGDRARALPGFAVWNRSKRGVTADLGSAAGRAQLETLCASADVFISDWFPAQADLEYDALARSNPRLIHCWMPPHGSRGGDARGPALDDLVAARSSLMANQWAHREGPVFLTIPAASYGTALLAAGAVCAALVARESSGRGQQVEVSWLAGALAMQTGTIIEHPALQRVMTLAPDPLGPIPVYRLFKASDGWLFIACGNPTFWNKLCLVLERPEMVSDPRFDGAPWAVAPVYWPELKALVQSIIATRPRDEWLRLLTEADIPCAPVRTRTDFIDDPQIAYLGMRREVEDAHLGRTIQMGVPVTLREHPGAIRCPAPQPSEQQAAISFEPIRQESVSTTSDARRATSQGGPLAGMLVLDFTNYIAGPFAGMALALAGADVIKVETPQGDPFRVFGFGFFGWNQSKRALALDFSKPAAREVLHDLVRKADVLVENLRPGATRRLGIDYETLTALNPRLVYGSLTGFGPTGPRGHEPGFDPLLQARSGLMAAQGGHGHEPVFLACAVCDYGGGLLCAYGVMAALLARQRSGRGQLVETSLAQAAMAVQCGEMIFYDGRPDMENGGPDLLGRHPLRRAYSCTDGWIFVSKGIVNRAQPALSSSKGESCSVFGVEIVIAEAMREVVDGPTATALAATFATRARRDVLGELAAAGVPAAPALTIGELFHDPQVIANDLIYETNVPQWGEFRQTGALVKYAATPVTIRPAPPLGQHTVEILRDVLGYPPDRIDALRAASSIICAP